MRCNPWRWLWGVPLLAMWFWITFASERGPVEADLTARTMVALQKAGHGWARTTFDGRDGALLGRAPSGRARENAVQVARKAWGVRVLKDETSLLEAVDRYVWSAAFAGDTIRLVGHVPNQKAHSRVLAAVKSRFPDVAVEDQLTLARGKIEVKPWLSGISFGLDQLSGLENGRLNFVNMDYSLAGTAPSYAIYKAVRTALEKKTPAGVRLAKQDVLPPTVSPYTWRAKRTGNQVVISGYVPSEKARTQLFEYAKKRFPKLAIIDRMETAAGAVPGWSRATGILLDQLARLEDGEAIMSDGDLSLTGRAPSETVADMVKAAADRDVPDSFAIKTDLTFPEPKPPTISPFVTSIDVEESRVRLFGYVPGEDERLKLLQVVGARFPDREVVDNLKLGSGQPQSWHACLVAGLSGVEKLGSGQVRLAGDQLSVSGETMDEAIFADLPGDVRAAANRACTSRVKLKLNAPPEPNLNWSASHDGTGEVVLDGDVPSNDTRSSLLAAAVEMFPKAKVIDRMNVVPGFSKKWHGVAHTGLVLLAKLRSGRAAMSGSELVVTGEAKDTAIASAVKGQLKNAIVRGYTGRGELTVRSDSMIWAEEEAKRKAAAAENANAEAAKAQAEAQARAKAAEDARREAETEARRKADEEARRRALAETRRQADEEARRKAREEARLKDLADARTKAADDARAKKAETAARVAQAREARAAAANVCREALDLLAKTGVIRFQFGSAELDRTSHPTLDKIAVQAGKCTSFKIIVSGHTDSVGSKRRNLSLSRRRARSVVDYLIGAGVSGARIDAVGYGETRPLVRNDSKANRAKNRRIEFDVR